MRITSNVVSYPLTPTDFRENHVLNAWHITYWKCGKSFRDRLWHKAFLLLLEFLDLQSLWKHRANHLILISGRPVSLGGTNLEKQVKNLIINPSILNLVSVLAWRGQYVELRKIRFHLQVFRIKEQNKTIKWRWQIAWNLRSGLCQEKLILL